MFPGICLVVELELKKLLRSIIHLTFVGSEFYLNNISLVVGFSNNYDSQVNNGMIFVAYLNIDLSEKISCFYTCF